MFAVLVSETYATETRHISGFLAWFDSVTSCCLNIDLQEYTHTVRGSAVTIQCKARMTYLLSFISFHCNRAMQVGG